MPSPPLRETLFKHMLVPKKSLGQNFIADPALLRRIAQAAGDLTNCTTVEIGPGPGGLTRALLDEGACHVIAIEKDERCVPVLDEIKTKYGERFSYIIGDALKISPKDLCDQPFKIIGNLPYHIATALILQWLDEHPLSMTLMVQKEVALRLTASPHTSNYGRLSIIVQWLCDTKRVFDIQPGAFTPPPKVVSSLVHLVPRDVSQQDLSVRPFLERLTHAAFSQRRKMLRASLRALFSIPELIDLKIDPQTRPQDLSISDFLTLASALKETTL